MIDTIGPRFNNLGNQFAFLRFTPEQQQHVVELLVELESIFKKTEKAA